MKRRRLSIDRPWQAVAVGMVVMTAMIVLIGNFNAVINITFFCQTPTAEEHDKVPIQLHAILHYATTQDLPQQSPKEIRVTFDVLFSLYPCNFLVFGLGHELMWASLNPNGFTTFLEESPHWVNMMYNESPNIRVHAIQHKTHLYEARDLLAHYKFEPNCLPPKIIS
ncbi:hypothetical protein Cgig2_030239 [Carnegiea gigantea]|uniref:Uncharacterized protein n=1 Tax=Carnegiea gigantea TaxID=171969 RepID=A0A9Q1KF15_9CARY|nr:hypothetical protein Cgig2_030239 [Carnegiea gigantea]